MRDLEVNPSGLRQPHTDTSLRFLEGLVLLCLAMGHHQDSLPPQTKFIGPIKKGAVQGLITHIHQLSMAGG